MWETIKNNPLLKTITIIILGVLSFGFAFNIMFGGGNMDQRMMNNGGGYSITNTLEIIMVLMIKVVIIALLIGALIWLIQAIRKSLSGNSVSPNTDWIKNDPIIRNSLIIIAVVFILGIIYTIFKGFIGSSYNGMTMMNNSYYVSNSFGVQSILVLLMKILLLLSVLGLGFGAFMYLKENKFKFITDLKTNYSIVCPECKAELKSNWKCCPNCGSDKAFVKSDDIKDKEV